MIKVKELRIGNLVNFTFYGLTEVNSVYSFDYKTVKITNDVSYQIEMVTAIPLTDEWLIKFGFEEKYKDRLINGFWNGGYCIENNYFNKQLFDFNHQDVNLVSVRYVHQLQNLYFALTGKELSV
jgi:hypothetical protein